MEGLYRFVAISAETQNAKGQPVRKYQKDIIRVGQYVDVGNDFEFEVTAFTLQHWVKTFAEMKANGVKVPIPNGHDDDGNADNNRGWVEDMFVENDRLIMVCELIGEDAHLAAARSDVSIYAPEEWTDGEGHTYMRPILHVALTSTPLIIGLGKFIPIAAARSLQKKKENEMDWKLIQKAMGIEVELTAENAVELVCSAATATSVKLADLEKKVEAQVLELSNKSEPKDPEPVEKIGKLTLNMASKYRQTMIDGLVSGGHQSPATAKALTEIHVNDTAIMASASEHNVDAFDNLIAALKLSTVIEFGEQTGPQTKMALSNAAAGGEDGALVAGAKAAKAAREAISK